MSKTKETRASFERPSTPISAANFVELFGWASFNEADIPVNREVALSVPAIWAAVDFISSTLASLPLDLYRRNGSGRDTANRDPLFALLHDWPNDQMTSYDWRKHAMENVLLDGRSVTFIERNGAGRVMNLWPLDLDGLKILRRRGRIEYEYKDGATKTVVYRADEVIDIVWRRKRDFISHLGPIDVLRNSIALSVAAERYAARFFAGGGVPPMQLIGPLQSPQAIERASKDLHQAIRNASKEKRQVLALPAGHELKPIAIDPEKAQIEAVRKFQIEECARIYSLSPIFLQDLSRGTFSNTEQQDLHVTKHTMTQWVRNWEQQLNLKLFSARNRTNFVEFNLDGLLRGDFKTRMDGYASAIQHGINTPNEVRRMENWPDQDGGDDLFMQGAMVRLKDVGANPAQGKA